MAIEALRLHNQNRMVDFFISDQAARTINLDAPYQRGHVWDRKRQRALIESILLHLPIGALVISKHDPGRYVVVDGKQRITALRAFADSALCVPREWFEDKAVRVSPSVQWVAFNDLTDYGQTLFLDAPISVSEAELSGSGEERHLFDLINFGGVPQGESDLSAVSDDDSDWKNGYISRQNRKRRKRH